MREERGMWDDASKKAKSNTSTDPVLEAALKSLSSQQIVARLQETLMKYRNERATVDELHRRLQAAGTEIAKAQRDRQRLEELEKIHVEQAEYYQKLIEKSAKLPKYEATIKSQTKIIAKLETVLEESLKKAGKSTKMLSELTRLKAANDTLRAEIQALKAKHRAKIEETRRENANNRQMIEAKDVEIKELLRAITREEKRFESHASTNKKSVVNQREEELQAEIGRLERSRDEHIETNKIMEARIQNLEAQLVNNSKHYGREISSLRVKLAKCRAKLPGEAWEGLSDP